jgi:hypothetical protein
LQRLSLIPRRAHADIALLVEAIREEGAIPVCVLLIAILPTIVALMAAVGGD